MAAALRRDPRFEVETVGGRYGEFTVLVDDEEVLSGGPLTLLGVLPSARRVREVLEAREAAAPDGATSERPRR